MKCTETRQGWENSKLYPTMERWWRPRMGGKCIVLDMDASALGMQVHCVAYTVVWENFVWNSFMYKIFMLKYFRGSWQLTIIKYMKCILYANIRAFNFHGLPAPRKYFNNKHFPNYGIYCTRDAIALCWRAERRLPSFRSRAVFLSFLIPALFCTF